MAPGMIRHNIWAAVTTNNAPSRRSGYTSVWTGSDMILWGGSGTAGFALKDGARYVPAANAWTAIPSTGAPTARRGHTAVWTGSEMVIWGGFDGAGYFDDTWSYF